MVQLMGQTTSDNMSYVMLGDVAGGLCRPADTRLGSTSTLSEHVPLLPRNVKQFRREFHRWRTAPPCRRVSRQPEF